MTTRNNTLYNNNAATVLLTGISDVATTLQPISVSGFPTPAAGEFFHITLTDNVNLEIIKVKGVSGGQFINCERGQQGTTARSWAASTKIEHRLTAGDIRNFARIDDRLQDVGGIHQLPLPSETPGNSALIADTDRGGLPIIAVLKDTFWSFPAYSTTVHTGAVINDSPTTTAVTAFPYITRVYSSGAKDHIIQFTSGANAGRCRFVTMAAFDYGAEAATRLTMSSALPVAPAVGDTFIVYRGSSANIVHKDGDAMTGSLHVQGGVSVSGNADRDLQAVPLQQVKDLIDEAILFAGTTPVGTVIDFYGTSAPKGWLELNGALVSRTTYSDLFLHASVSGLLVTEASWASNSWGMFGEGNGTTTFRLPDLRGEFVRGADKGRGVSTGHNVGSFQYDTQQNITGSFGASSSDATSLADGTGAFAHDGPTSAQWGADPKAPEAGFTFDASRVARTGTETRPRNVALLKCIKAGAATLPVGPTTGATNNVAPPSSGTSGAPVAPTPAPAPAGVAPGANFTYSIIDRTSAETIVSFTDLSTNSPSSWSWVADSGYGGFATTQNPTFTFVPFATGYMVYVSVTLTVSNAYGSSVATKSFIIPVGDYVSAGI